MTPENFSAFLNSPEDERISIDNLQKLIEKYPYVQSLRIAFLKKLKAENHPDFEKYLSQTATYTYDRNFLRKYINGESIYILEYVNNQVNSESLETLELMPLKLIDDGTLIEKEKLSIENSEKEVLTNNKVLKVEKPIEEEETTEEDLLIAEEKNVASEIFNNQKLLSESVELELVEEEVSNNYSFDEKETIIDDIGIEVSKNDKSAVDIREVIEELPKNEETLENINENIDEMEQAIIEKKSLDNDIQHLIIDSKKIDYHPPIEENIDDLIEEEELEGLDDEIEFGFEIDEKIIANDEDISIFDNEAVEHEEEVHSHHEKEIKESHKNVVGKDLDEEPKIKQSELDNNIEKTEFIPEVFFVKGNLNPENEKGFSEEFQEEGENIESRENVEKIKAVLSRETASKEDKKNKIKAYLQRIARIPLEEESMISETYAGLLAKQGKIERSIRMYQQLILKNPQKKVYFAAKIKQLIKSI